MKIFTVFFSKSVVIKCNSFYWICKQIIIDTLSKIFSLLTTAIKVGDQFYCRNTRVHNIKKELL